MALWSAIKNETKLLYDKLHDQRENLFHPTIRLGVTGLSGSGKTVFITALVHSLLNGKNLFFFKALQEKNIHKILIEQTAGGLTPRFEFENHKYNIEHQIWPHSTKNLSQIRISFYYKSVNSFKKFFSHNKLSIDIIDYPGEWLIDLPLLRQSFKQFSLEAYRQTQNSVYHKYAEPWLNLVKTLNEDSHIDETKLRAITKAYHLYLRAVHQDPTIQVALPPGRFLLANEYEDSPAFTFFPLLDIVQNKQAIKLYGPVLKERFQLYKKHFVFPFFREHIARLNRQVILLDFMRALNHYPTGLTNLRQQLTPILRAFHIAPSSWMKRFFYHHIDRVLIAATKADQLHHSEHDQLEALVAQFIKKTMPDLPYNEASSLGRERFKIIALASIRTTREASFKEDGEILKMVIGTAEKNEILDGQILDGQTETALYPGSLPPNLTSKIDNDLHFVRFKLPLFDKDHWPHIRLDRALDFLLKDKLS